MLLPILEWLPLGWRRRCNKPPSDLPDEKPCGEPQHRIEARPICAQRPQNKATCPHAQVAGITRLVLNDKLPTEEIVVLIVDRLAYRTYYEALIRSPLPKLIQISDDPSPRTGCLRVLTAAKFKGLESAVAFVWGVDAISSDSKRQELYVALSRPRNELYVIGTSLALEEIRNYTLCA
jgi:hypothetical protein